MFFFPSNFNVKGFLRSSIGVLLGLNIAVITLFVIDLFGDSMFPYSPIPFDNKSNFLKWIQEIPNGKLFFIILTSIFSNLLGGFVSVYYSNNFRTSYVIGIFFSVYHYFIIKRSLEIYWFFYFNFMLQLPSSYYGGILAKKIKNI